MPASCIICGRPVPEGRRKLCSEPCRLRRRSHQEVDQRRRRRRAGRAQRNCRECGALIPLERGSARVCSDDCRLLRRRRYYQERHAAKAAEKPKAVGDPDELDLPGVLQRVRASGGAELAEAFVASLNRTRRAKGKPEVRL